MCPDTHVQSILLQNGPKVLHRQVFFVRLQHEAKHSEQTILLFCNDKSFLCSTFYQLVSSDILTNIM